MKIVFCVRRKDWKKIIKQEIDCYKNSGIFNYMLIKLFFSKFVEAYYSNEKGDKIVFNMPSIDKNNRLIPTRWGKDKIELICRLISHETLHSVIAKCYSKKDNFDYEKEEKIVQGLNNEVIKIGKINLYGYA